MPTTINGATGVSLVQDGTLTQSKLSTNVVGNGPCFSAYQSTQQTIGSGNTKIQFQSKDFDTTGAFDNTTNYRFQPLVAGYYNVMASVQINNTAIAYIYLQKNGSVVRNGIYSGVTSTNPVLVAVALMTFNGTTDYVEVMANTTASSSGISAASSVTCFSAFMVRSA